MFRGDESSLQAGARLNYCGAGGVCSHVCGGSALHLQEVPGSCFVRGTAQLQPCNLQGGAVGFHSTTNQ